jgi:hypothetical protein
VSLALALALAAPPAPSDLDIEWDAPRDCPDASEVRARIDELADPGGGRRSGATVQAQVHQEGERWILELTLDVPEGRARRSLDGASCEVVADAAALIVAVMLDPQTVLEDLERAPEPVPEPAPKIAPEPEPAPKTSPAPKQPRARKVRGILGIAGTGTFGALPRFGGGLLATAGIDSRYVRAEAITTYDAPQLRLVDAEARAGAVFDLWTAGVRGCGLARVQTLVIPVCAGVELGALRARGEGLEVRRRVNLLHARATVGAGLSWAATRWLELRAEVAGLVTLSPWRVVIDDLGEVHRSRPVGIRAGLGFAAIFP